MSHLWHHCGTVKEEAALRKELGLRDLVLAQVLCVVGSSWVGVAAKLGRAHVVFWLVAMLAFYVPLAAVVIYLNRLMPLEGGLYQWAKAGVRRDGGLSDRVEPVGVRRGRGGRDRLRGADGPRIPAGPRVGVAGGEPLGDARPDRRRDGGGHGGGGARPRHRQVAAQRGQRDDPAGLRNSAGA